MGFTTGFLSGLTLTTFTLYLSIAYHRQNRLSQSLTLRQSSLILTHIVEPQPTTPLPVPREERNGLMETAKDRWNGELEGLVKRAQRTDWGAVRSRLGERASEAWSRISNSAGSS